jgi:hypothetical protein
MFTFGLSSGGRFETGPYMRLTPLVVCMAVLLGTGARAQDPILCVLGGNLQQQ